MNSAPLPMRILHVAQSFDLCGRSRMIHDLCTGLTGKGFEFAIAVLDGAPGYRQTDVPCISLGRKSGISLRTILRLARHIRKGRFAVLHSHGRGGAVYAALACWLARPRRWVHTVHRSDGDRISGNLRFGSWALSKMDHVAAVSEAALTEFNKVNKGRLTPRSVIYNGIQLARFTAGCRRTQIGKPVLGAVANLSPDKDFQTLLRGFASVARAIPDVRLVIAGDGPARSDAERLAADLGVASRVEFAGFRSDIPELLPTFDVLVHSTHTEGLGLAILEAMAARVPVVASAVGGIPEIVRDGVTGRLFPAGDAEALCKAVLSSLHEKEKTSTMADAAFADVHDRFSVERMCESYRRLYEGWSIRACCPISPSRH